MKPKEYIKKFGINSGWDSSKQNSFLAELSQELIATFELFDKPDNSNIFDQSVSIIKQKWDSISKRIPFGLPDKLWNYFYATAVVPLKEKLCPTFTKQCKIKDEEERKEREMREERSRKFHEALHREYEEADRKFRESVLEGFAEYFAFFDSGFGNSMFGSLFGRVSVPEEAFSYFGLSSDASKEDVLGMFHDKILKVHPDKGGSKELAVECIENKNKCLQYISSKEV